MKPLGGLGLVCGFNVLVVSREKEDVIPTRYIASFPTNSEQVKA